MNIADIRAQIESEITWRRNELRFLSNILLGLDDQAEQARFRKALVVMLYAHFEGFFRAALTIYVRSINQQGLMCGEVIDALAAAALSPIFDDLSSNRKSEFFKGELPHDERLHRFARQADFIGKVRDTLLESRPAQIPEDIVDPESNLKPIVLKKNLFRLGFDPMLFKDHDGTINELLMRRNNVAHGLQIEGIDQNAFDPLQKSVFEIMDEVSQQIGSALDAEKYLKPKAPSVSAIAAQID